MSLDRVLLVLALGSIPACVSDRNDVVGGAQMADGETGDGGDGGDDSDDDGGDGSKFDVAPGEGEGGGDDVAGCHKVDFLFVIDNSGSMEDEQNNLINSFPGFIEHISQTLNAQDYHVMAVATDNGEGGGMNTSCANGECTCTPAPMCCASICASNMSCNGFDCNNLPTTPCDLEWGTGKMWDAEGNFCNLAADMRYMVDGQPDVAGTFECIAHVGTYGSGAEKPMLAMGWAVSEDHNGPSGCNEGFLRDDAILVLTLITDEEDDRVDPDALGSPGEPPDWVKTVVDAKLENDTAVVALGLLDDCESVDSLCAPCGDPNSGDAGAERSPRLHEFITSFPYHVLCSICAPDYTECFVEATEIIDLSCDEFVPPG